MANVPDIQKAYKLSQASANYNPTLNAHYDFNNQDNLNEIDKMAGFDKAFSVVYGMPFPDLQQDEGTKDYVEAKEFIRQAEIKALGNGAERYEGGGAAIPKPWGSNVVLAFSTTQDGVEICDKEIVVFGHRQLSLQKHRGRAEIWTVTDNQDGTSGILTVSLNDKVYEVSKAGIYEITAEIQKTGERKPVALDKDNFGQTESGDYFIVLPAGSVHAMNNIHDTPVTVLETQTGITFEADNDRLIEALEDKPKPRATIPLVNPMEVTAAKNFILLEKINNPHWDNGLRYAQKSAPATLANNGPSA